MTLSVFVVVLFFEVELAGVVAVLLELLGKGSVLVDLSPADVEVPHDTPEVVILVRVVFVVRADREGGKGNLRLSQDLRLHISRVIKVMEQALTT